MKVDFHLHTNSYSRCALATAKEQMRASIQAGVDVVFITEHMKLFPQDEIDRLQKKYPEIRIYQGIEVTVQDNSYDDFIVLGVHDKAIEKKNWTYKALYEFVKRHKGAIILAHPYRFSDEVNEEIWQYPPDGIEVLSSNVGRHGYERRKLLAKELDKPMVTNSDSHYTEYTGCYTNIFSWECYDEESIVNALIQGEFECSKL